MQRMLTRIFVDNFRALVNFELRPGPLSLLLGDNGSGKTSLFDALGSVSDLVARGNVCNACFPAWSKTKWDTRTLQRFELDIQGNGGQYRYELEVQHPEAANARPSIRLEGVTFESKPLYRFTGGEVRLFQDDHTPGPTFPFRAEHSFLPNVEVPGSTPGSSKLAWFNQFMRGIQILHAPLSV